MAGKPCTDEAGRRARDRPGKRLSPRESKPPQWRCTHITRTFTSCLFAGSNGNGVCSTSAGSCPSCPARPSSRWFSPCAAKLPPRRALEVSVATIWRVRHRFCTEGFESALAHKHPRQLNPPRLDGRGQAQLFALACSEPPQGRARWTLQLLADQLVELEIVPHICQETVRKTLKKGLGAAPEEAVVHPARAKRRLCLCDGRRANPASSPQRNAASAGL